MAFIDAQTAKSIRQGLKEEFPKVKFSVRKDGNIAINVTVLKSELFDDGVDTIINHYHYHIDRNSNFNDEQKEFLKKVDETIRVRGNYFDNSVVMIDHFDTAFYYNIRVGDFDKPHEKI